MPRSISPLSILREKVVLPTLLEPSIATIAGNSNFVNVLLNFAVPATLDNGDDALCSDFILSKSLSKEYPREFKAAKKASPAGCPRKKKSFLPVKSRPFLPLSKSLIFT